MNNEILALLCTENICQTLNYPRAEPMSLSMSAEYEGEFYVFLANLLRIGDKSHNPQPYLLKVLTELPTFLSSVLAVCVIHQDVMIEEYIQQLILERLKQLPV